MYRGSFFLAACCGPWSGCSWASDRGHALLPQLNLAPFLTFGRLRPLHTNAVIFAFCGNIIFGGTYHSMQRLLKTRLFSGALSQFHFWGWQFLIVCAALALVGGVTQGKDTPSCRGCSTS